MGNYKANIRRKPDVCMRSPGSMERENRSGAGMDRSERTVVKFSLELTVYTSNNSCYALYSLVTWFYSFYNTNGLYLPIQTLN